MNDEKIRVNTSYQPPQPRLVEQKLETAIEFYNLLPTTPVNEDEACLKYVVAEYIKDLSRVIGKKKLSEEDYYRVRSAQALTAVLLEEMWADKDSAKELSDWYYGAPENGNQVWYLANLLTDALQQFTEAMMLGRRRDFNPLTDDDYAAIARIL